MPPLADLSLATYLERLASNDPAPGGGAAVAFTGAQAASLLAMVARISSTSRPDLLDALDRSRRRFLALADLDAQAFIAVLAAYKLPQGTAEEKSARQERIQHALRGATDVPLEVMGRLSDLFPLAADVIAGAKPTVVSDAGIAVHLLAAGLKAARYNVAINLKYLRDEGFKDKTEAAVAGLLVGKKERRKQLLAQVKALLD